MTKELAALPAVTPADVANARAFAIQNGNTIGARGRIPVWAVNEWVAALRPVLVAPVVRTPGKRGRASTVVVEGTTRTVSKVDAQHARAWAQENGIAVPARGRLSVDVLQGWANAGAPTYREERATVYYRALDKKGRPNGKERIGIVYADMLGSGKPRMSDYWSALGIDGIPLRIIAGAMKINVSRDDEGTFVYEWVSKSDSKTVVDMLKGNISLHI